MKKFLFGIFLLIMFLSLIIVVKADELDDINNAINSLKKDLNSKEANYQDLNVRIKEIKNKLNQLEQEINKKEIEVKKGEEALSYQKELLNERAKSYYKNVNKNSTLFLSVLVADDLSTSLRKIFYQKTIVDEDKKMIIKIVLYVKNLEDIKKQLEIEKSGLARLKIEVDKQSEIIADQISQTRSKIAELTAKQQSILTSRSGSFTASIGDSELADDINASIKGFRESAPSGSFAVFSFGGYTHRKGMSQYGARGRAQSGQDYKAILKAYYGKEPVSKDTGGEIKVSGIGSINFEEKYLYGIAEMPSSWHPEALKAQAIAARSYAYRYKKDDKEICTNEACQVYLQSKADNPPQEWKDAVNNTRGQIIEDVVTYYASTHGAFTTTMGWDTTDGSGGSNFVDKSYEKAGGSPWVYKAWYTEKYSINSDKCGRSNPWLNGEEMADIVNATLILSKGSGEELERVTPISSCWGGNPYSMDELRNVAGKYGGISSANSVSVSQGNGITNEVVINGITLSGADFKKAFNLRAPGRLSIPQSGFAFFNIEKR